MRNLCAVLILALVALCAAPSFADVHGTGYGIVRAVTPNFDGAGGCRMLLEYDRFNVLDFDVSLAHICTAATLGAYFQAIVDDAPPIPCEPWSCSKLSALSRYVVAGTIP